MVPADLQAAFDWLAAHEDDLVRDTRSMLRIPSIEGDPAPNAPFGAANREALDLALKLAQDDGFRTVDLEGYIGYAEFGEGPLILSLGHLDVVPVGDGWKHDPFGAEIDGDYLYARGATDDKGPTMASFYAMRALKAACPNLGVRLRQAFGCNEESGFRCVERYMRTEEAPVFGVAPDSGWPLYHAEKGIANLEISAPLVEGLMALVEVSGGQRPNIVIDKCHAVVRVAPEARAEVEGKLQDQWDRNVCAAWDGDLLRVEAIGKAAHGSTPFAGDSAATRVFRFLAEISPLDGQGAYEDLRDASHPSGAGIGILGADEPSGDLTANLGMVSTVDGRVRLLVNVRYPVTWKAAELEAKCRARLEQMGRGWTLDVTRDSPPLYFPLDHPMVKAIVDVYEAETGERRTPGTMGGGTYARAVPNTVSIGTGWEGDGKAHETDERIKVAHLGKMARIYAHIFYRLAALATGRS
jgi:succinyl-diaminopimelate desuccinylase